MHDCRVKGNIHHQNHLFLMKALVRCRTACLVGAHARWKVTPRQLHHLLESSLCHQMTPFVACHLPRWTQASRFSLPVVSGRLTFHLMPEQQSICRDPQIQEWRPLNRQFRSLPPWGHLWIMHPDEDGLVNWGATGDEGCWDQTAASFGTTFNCLSSQNNLSAAAVIQKAVRRMILATENNQWGAVVWRKTPCWYQRSEVRMGRLVKDHRKGTGAHITSG